jgi:hypothetical protein
MLFVRGAMTAIDLEQLTHITGGQAAQAGPQPNSGDLGFENVPSRSGMSFRRCVTRLPSRCIDLLPK